MYSFTFFMAMVGELCCITWLGCNLSDEAEKKLKKAIKSNERVMRWINE